MSAVHSPVILTYHSISEGESPLKISPALFAEQMEWLQNNAQVLSLGDVFSALVERRPLPDRAVVLTFDDGFRDFLGSASPVLSRCNFTATIFLATSYCGASNSWRGQPDWVRHEPLLNWREIIELSVRGFLFGAHSMNHPSLPTLPLNQVEREISGSKAEIENHTNQPVEFFAYPFGYWNPAVRDLVRQYFRGACSTGAGVIEPDADPFALPRVDAHYVRDPTWFKRLFTSSFLNYLRARRLVRRLRGRPEGIYARVRV